MDGVTGWVPESCSLPTVEQPLRVAEFDRLFRESVLRSVRLDATRLELVLAADEVQRGHGAWLSERSAAVRSFASTSIPAIKSTKGKHDPDLPIKHWWITAPVAEAVVVAEQLSTRGDRLFPPLFRQDAVAPRSDQMLERSPPTSTRPAPGPDWNRSRPAGSAHICFGERWRC